MIQIEIPVTSSKCKSQVFFHLSSPQNIQFHKSIKNEHFLRLFSYYPLRFFPLILRLREREKEEREREDQVREIEKGISMIVCEVTGSWS